MIGTPPPANPRGAAPIHGVGVLAGANASAPGTFTGAVLPICGVEVLIVVVRPWVLADIHEANLYVVAFHERFRRTIVLMAQGPDGAPYYYGPTEIMRVLHGLPFELIPWRQWLFRTAPPPSWQLPISQGRGRAGRTDGVDRAAIAYRAAGAPGAAQIHGAAQAYGDAMARDAVSTYGANSSHGARGAHGAALAHDAHGAYGSASAHGAAISSGPRSAAISSGSRSAHFTDSVSFADHPINRRNGRTVRIGRPERTRAF